LSITTLCSGKKNINLQVLGYLSHGNIFQGPSSFMSTIKELLEGKKEITAVGDPQH
jgi:hypothetical protein